MREIAYLILLVSGISFLVTAVMLHLLRDWLASRIFAIHRLEFLTFLSRKGALATSFALLPIKREILFGPNSCEFFEVAGIKKYRNSMRLLWIAGELSEAALFISFFWIMIS